jgi:hypothetical protein
METGLSTGRFSILEISPVIPPWAFAPLAKLHREAVHARKTSCVDRLRYMPKIHQNAGNDEYVQHHGSAMENTERSGGALLHLRGALQRVFAQVQFTHAGLQDMAAEQPDQKQRHQKQKDQPMERAARIKPFAQQVRDRYGRTPLLYNKIAMHDQLRRRSRIRLCQQANHLIAEKGRSRRKGEKNHRAEPYCRIHDGDDA